MQLSRGRLRLGLPLRADAIEEMIDQARFVEIREVEREVFFDFAAEIRRNVVNDLMIDLLRRCKEAALDFFWPKQGSEALGHLADQTPTFLQMHIMLLAVG